MSLLGKLKEMSILLIDDDEWIRDALNLFFEANGCCLTAVETAEDGMTAIRKRYFDVLIVDYRLPGMNGLEFFEKIRISHPYVLKIMISAYDSRELFAGARQAGVADIIEKPFSVGIIEATLNRLLDHQT